MNVITDYIQGIPQIDSELYEGKMIVIIHNTATPGATAKNENDYFHREWSNIRAFVHAFVDWNGDVYENAEFGKQVWGGGNVNKYAFLQVEQCISTDDSLNRLSAEKTAEYVAQQIHKSGRPFEDFLIMSHGDATVMFGGSDHYDTIEGLSWDEFISKIKTSVDDYYIEKYPVVIETPPVDEYITNTTATPSDIDEPLALKNTTPAPNYNVLSAVIIVAISLFIQLRILIFSNQNHKRKDNEDG